MFIKRFINKLKEIKQEEEAWLNDFGHYEERDRGEVELLVYKKVVPFVTKVQKANKNHFRRNGIRWHIGYYNCGEVLGSVESTLMYEGGRVPGYKKHYQEALQEVIKGKLSNRDLSKPFKELVLYKGEYLEVTLANNRPSKVSRFRILKAKLKYWLNELTYLLKI